MRAFYNFLLQKNVFIYLLAILTVALGLVATVTTTREAYPQVEFGTITIHTLYPGASPEETESFVTNEIEKEIKDIQGIDEMTSVSAEGRSYVTVILEAGEDVEAILSDVQSAVDRIQFPEDVEDPIATKMDSGAFPIITLSLTGDAKNYTQLRATAKALETRLSQLNGVGDITMTNYLDHEYRVNVIPSKLRDYYVSLKDIIESISGRSINLPGGKIETEKTENIVRSVGEFDQFADVQDVVIRANDVGNVIRIQDVATVDNRFEEATEHQRTKSQDSIGFTIIKQESADIVKTIDLVFAEVDQFLEQPLYEGYAISYSNDMSEEINRRLTILFDNAKTGILIVFIALFIFLNFKVATLVAVGIPFSILGAMIFTKAIGITINLVSLLGFIVVIGMIVDNAIVVGENIYDKFEKGEDAKEATIKGTQEVLLPIIFSTLTTFAAFSPLLLMGGIIGKFVWSIPVLVILSIAASLFYAGFILPNLMHNILKGSKLKSKKGKFDLFESLQGRYEWLVRKLIRLRLVVFGSFVLLLVFTIGFVGSQMDFDLFPNEDPKAFNILFEGPTNMRLGYLDKEIAKVEKIVAKLDENTLDTYLTTVGSKMLSGMGDMQKGSNVGQITVLLTPIDERDMKAREIIEQIREQVTALNLDNIRVNFELEQNGPPVGKPVQIDILGQSFDEIQSAMAKIEAKLGTYDGVKDIQNSYRIGKSEIRIDIDEVNSAKANLSMRQVATEIRSAMGGTVATVLRRGDEEIDVRVIYDEQFRHSPDNLYRLQIPNNQNQLVDIMSITNVSTKEGLSDISHSERKRVISVTADIDKDKTTSMEVNRDIRPFLIELNQSYPTLQFLQRGENEDTQESIQNLFVAFVFAMFLIFMIIASLFNSIVEPLVIMLAIPFGIIGVILAFFFHGAPISFMMLMGVIGMSGVVVNNTIILVTVITDFRKEGVNNIDSIVEGGKARLRAVLLSSLTTLLGLFPTAYGLGGRDPFIIPLCLSLAWGIMFSTILTLFLLPCTYALFDDMRATMKKIKLPGLS